MFLENEGWELCPVRSSFTILKLQEIQFMRHMDMSQLLSRSRIFTGSDAGLSSATSSTSDNIGQHKTYFSSELSPFDEQQDEEVNEDFFATNGDDLSSDSDEDIASELKADYIEDGTGSPNTGFSDFSIKQSRRQKSIEKDRRSNPPVLTNSSLTVLRQFGKYMRMMSLLEPIAFQVITCMSQLFDFYFYTVYRRFAVGKIADDPEEHKPGKISSRLHTTLQRLTNELQRNGTSVYTPPQSNNNATAENLYNISEKIVAIESLVYLGRQFEFLQPHLEKIIPSSKKAFLQQFYSQTISTVSELRYPVYQAVTDRILNQEQIINSITSIKWDIRDIMSQHNGYVDIILRDFQMFSMRLSEVSHYVPVSRDVLTVLWQQCGQLAAQTFVEGYSSVKKCTTEGRALMLLDFQQFLTKFETIAETRAVPGREYVETYIKAYYLPDDTLESWVKDHKEYSSRQLMMLVNSVPQLNKKGRQKILSQIEDLEERDIVGRTNSPLAKLENFTKRHRRDKST